MNNFSLDDFLAKLTQSQGTGVWGKACAFLAQFLPSGLTGRSESTPDEGSSSGAKGEICSVQTTVFLCHEPTAGQDCRLSEHLRDLMSNQGHQVFTSDSMPADAAAHREPPLQASHFLVVLLSQESARSGMVRAAVRGGYEYRKLQECPRTLLVRLGDEGLLPDAIGPFLDPMQYVVWQSPADNERVGQELLAAIEGRLSSQPPRKSPKRKKSPLAASPQPAPIRRTQAGGGEHAEGPPLAPPSPSIGGGGPGGWGPWGATPGGKFYVERDADAKLKREITKAGASLTTIRAARQAGKTSLLVQGIHHAREHGIKVVNLDLQRVEKASLQTLDRFLRYLAEFIVWELSLDINRVAQLWSTPRGSQDKLSMVLSDVLSESTPPIVLAMDDVDRLLETDFHTDFFALVRSWYNSRTHKKQWRKLNLVLAISTEPHLLIANSNQSPFNVGPRLSLRDFSEAQVRDLNQLHGSPVQEREIAQMMRLLNGHPYLTRQAFYTLLTESMSWAELSRLATSDLGPFAEHLRRYDWWLRNNENLKAALKQVIQKNRCLDETIFYRLRRAGLITGRKKSCACRCELYRIYFKDKF